MKQSLLLLLVAFLLPGIPSLQAQSDKGFSYQAVARDNNGAILSNTGINLRFQFRQGSANGTVVYQETHSATTNEFGLFHAIIGKGTAEVGVFANVPWSDDDYFLVVELNGAGVDTSLLEGVPYAKVATNMDLAALQDVSAINPGSGEILKWDGTTWAAAPDQTNDADADPSNELQTLSLSGTNLSISNGNMVSLPTGTTYTPGTGIGISGNTISNTSPDQTVSLTGSGATNVTGSYPNFTITSTDNVNDADASTTNEIQALSLSGNNLNLSLGGGSVNLSALASPWSSSGGNLYYNTGNVGIGDNSPTSTFTVGNGDKFQVNGSDGDVVFNDDQGSIRFANASGANAPMLQMFSSGTSNSTRMFLAHSPSFPTWGIRYNDTADAFTWIGDNIPVLHVQLAGQQRVGVGTETPEAKFHVSTNSATGFGQIKLTEQQFDFSRITMNNNIHSNYWDIAARTDTNLSNATFNIYHSDVGDILSVNAQGRVGINDASPAYPVEVNGNESSRIMNLYNTLPTTTSTTYNYGLRIALSQATNTGFPRLYNIFAISTDTDAYLTYGLYGYASGASSNNYGVYAYAPTSSGYAVYASGNMYCTGSYLPSDARLKTDVEDLPSGLSTVMQLKPKQYQYDNREYDFMNLPTKQQYGFLAQDVQEILPELTNESFHAYDEALNETEEGQGMHFTAVNYIGFIPIMVAGMQEQQEIIEAQKQQIDDLEARIQRLEALIGQ